MVCYIVCANLKIYALYNTPVNVNSFCRILAKKYVGKTTFLFAIFLHIIIPCTTPSCTMLDPLYYAVQPTQSHYIKLYKHQISGFGFWISTYQNSLCAVDSGGPRKTYSAFHSSTPLFYSIFIFHAPLVSFPSTGISDSRETTGTTP